MTRPRNRAETRADRPVRRDGRPRIRVLVLVSILLGSAAAGACASVQFVEERYQRQAEERLERHFQQELAAEWVPAGETRSGSLGLRESAEFTADLTAGRGAAILGSCDRDCGELNLQVEDESGFVLQTDRPEDRAFPFVEFVPERSGTYSVRVGMVECSDEPCIFALRFLQRREAGDAPDR